jgi:hypothetical protein
MFLSGKCNQSVGALSLPVLFRQGWDTTNLNPRCRGSYPSQKTRRLGHPLLAALPTQSNATLSLRKRDMTIFAD